MRMKNEIDYRFIKSKIKGCFWVKEKKKMGEKEKSMDSIFHCFVRGGGGEGERERRVERKPLQNSHSPVY